MSDDKRLAELKLSLVETNQDVEDQN